MTDSQGFKTVATFNDKVQADICAALLGDHGIPAGVFGADSSYPSLGYASSIQVKVNEDDYSEAINISAAVDSAE